ncbi:MAG: hypothetical protein KDB27_12910 [Planctomycetales bacterium]|nr:hypothetical protein [Planctomycetales bacterium]
MMRTIASTFFFIVVLAAPCFSDVPVGYFGNAGLILGEEINSATLDGNPVLSSDGLPLYFTSDRDFGPSTKKEDFCIQWSDAQTGSRDFPEVFYFHSVIIQSLSP